MTKTRFDIVIVGYGPIGQILALLIGQAGYRVAAFEHYPDLYPLPRAVHLDHEALRILQAIGVIDAMRPELSPPMMYGWHNAKGETLLLLDWTGIGPSGWHISNFFPQPQLQTILHSRIQKLSTVEVYQGWEAIAATQQPDFITLNARNREGEQIEVQGRYLIGADGANSFVREQMQATTITDLGFFFDWLVVDIVPHEEREWYPAGLQICDPARPTTLVPGGKGRRRWEFMRLPGESPEELNHPDTVWRLLASWQITPQNATLERHTIYTFRALWANSWREGRFLLAGDAAHLMPPFAGQGMCAGLRDAFNLAWKLDLVLAGRAREMLLDSYTSERLTHVQHFIHYSVELGSIICIADEATAAARDARMLAARQNPEPAPPDTPPPLGPGILHREDPLAGQLFIQGEVISNGQKGLFDDVVGRGFCLISTMVNPTATLSPALLQFFDSLQPIIVTLTTNTMDSAGRIVDSNGTYVKWFAQHNCTAVLVRPDFYIFGTASSQQKLSDLVNDLYFQLTRSAESTLQRQDVLEGVQEEHRYKNGPIGN